MLRLLRLLLPTSKNQDRVLDAAEKAANTAIPKTKSQSQTESSSTTTSRSSTRYTWEFSRKSEYPYDHYSDATDRIKQLKRDKKHTEALELLHWCIDYTEEETQAKGRSTLAPWYYKHAAIVYRKEGQYGKEVDVLNRYRQKTRRVGGEPREYLLDRLEKAKKLQEKHER